LSLRLYNTLRRKKEDFVPLDPKNVRMYVCGPTVYDHAHIGNARPVIVFDVLYRLLRHIYGGPHVKYVRNITDVDDKIIERAAAQNIAIDELTKTTADQYHTDVAALGCLVPDVEPRATDHIAEMIAIIEKLIAGGHAYEAEGHVLFDVPTWKPYGELSNRSVDEMIAGARVEVAPYKKNPVDFVLWKPSTDEQPGWDSPWGRGRPGWHIECSAMAEKHLGEVFDIHGGGVDLTFPHHENEIAQSRCAHDAPVMANIWMHNGFLQVEGKKMSKSAGNFFTIRDLLEKWPGEVLRYNMLRTAYRQPIDWTDNATREASRTIDNWYAATAGVEGGEPDAEFVSALSDDLNTPKAIAVLHALRYAASEGDEDAARRLKASAQLIGLLQQTESDWKAWRPSGAAAFDDEAIQAMVDARIAARNGKDFAEADRLRDELVALGVVLMDNPGGTEWEKKR